MNYAASFALAALLLGPLAAPVVAADPQAQFETPSFSLSFDPATGRPASLKYQGQELLNVRSPGGFTVQPMKRDGAPEGKPQRLERLSFPQPGVIVVSSADGGRAITFEVKSRPRHLAFRITSLRGFPVEETVRLEFELNLTLTGQVARSIGAVRGDALAVGAQSLDYMTWSELGLTGDGSWLRVTWSSLWRRSPGDPLGGFALFVCPEPRTLETIGQLEVEEGLPHPMHSGVWAKVANGVSRLTQMWFVFDPSNPREMGDAVQYLEKSGVHLFYLPQHLWQGPGLFTVKTQFWAEGAQSLRAFSDRLHARGILLGLHTGSAGIFMGDPVLGGANPHEQLACWAKGKLAQAAGAADDILLFQPDAGWEPPVILGGAPQASRPPFYPRHWSADWIQVGGEVVHFDKLDATPGGLWRLSGCRRARNGSVAAAHPAGTAARGLLVTYGTCFAPDVDSPLFTQSAAALARLVNDARVARMSFDALEMSDYLGYWGSNKYMTLAARGFDHAVACESSNGVPQYQWHIASYANVGEGMHTLPKAYFEGYLAGNCKASNAAFLPGALGAFTFRTDAPEHLASSPDEWEWLLSKAAGYDAAFFFETDMKVFKGNGQTDCILSLVKNWEDARIARAFTDAQRERLREYEMSFRITPGLERWSVMPLRIQKRFLKADGGATAINNPFAPQPLRFEIRVLPAFDYADPRNLPLLPADLGQLRIAEGLSVRSVSGKAVPGGQGVAVAIEGKDVSIEDYLAIMGTGDTAAGRDARPQAAGAALNGAGHTLLLSATNSGRSPSGPLQADWTLPETVNLTSHRGVGLWATGDGKGGHLFFELVADGNRMVRKYVVPLDFTGRRYVEVPTGEIGCDYYGLWGWNNGWSSIKLGFNYGRIRTISFGLIGVPPGATVNCAIESPKALAEDVVPLGNPVLETGDGRRLDVIGTVDTGEYLVYEGGAEAEVLNASRHTLRRLPVRLSGWELPAGRATVAVRVERGPAPYVRLLLKPAGEPLQIPNPTAEAQRVYRDITH
jgi:hypothetical protein